MNIALIRPDIPHNTGAIGRLCVANDVHLHLVKPLGFSLDEKAVKRAGLDYWEHIKLTIWENLEEFEAHLIKHNLNFWLYTTKTEQVYWEQSFANDDFHVFGSETRGLPESFLEAHPSRCVTIPMKSPEIRSLNLATAAGIAMYEHLRQIG